MKYNFTLKKRKIIVTATIKNDDEIKEIDFILDTGAATTILDTTTARYLGYDLVKLPEKRLTTIGGGKTANVLKINSIQLFGKIIYNLDVDVVELSPQITFLGNGLIGMDLLLKFKELKINFWEKIIEV